MSEPVEFSRRVPLDRIGPKPVVHEIVAAPAECAALAKRFDILGVEALSATVTLARVGAAGAVNLTGHLRAQVVQACIVTLEPVKAAIEEDFAVAYEPAGEAASEIDLNPDPDDASVEPLPQDAIDVGESVAQQLALALDPYPRSPTARLEAEWPGDTEKPGSGPFSALRALKKGRS
jgi:uncharacterized metal-binding protein YceD (DUF177 family)